MSRGKVYNENPLQGGWGGMFVKMRSRQPLIGNLESYEEITLTLSRRAG